MLALLEIISIVRQNLTAGWTERAMKCGYIVMMAMAVTLTAVRTVPPAWAQETQPVLANSPDVVQWTRIDSSMSELLQQGYRLVSVNEIITNPPIQDVMTTFYLFRDSDLVRCQEGARLLSEKYWVTSCARIAKPYEVKSN
jgi:hypothetical protein